MMEQSNDNMMFLDGEPEVNPEGFFNELSSQNACSVRVAVRVRPLIGIELNDAAGSKTCVEVSDIDSKLQIGQKQFQFDRVFSSDSSQKELFDVCARNLVLGCFVGYNATILAYGQTGSGKTHTMGTGSTNGLDEENIGIVPRVFAFIFEELDRKKKQSSLSDFTIKISFLELYNEELHDLLDPLTIGAIDRSTGKPMKELFIKEKSGAIYVQGLKEEIVQSKEECVELLNKGINHRTTSATLMNEGSSRSHAIFTISIEQRLVKEIEVPEGAADMKAGQQEEHITAKFHFVDLAGSERLKRTGAIGQQMKEGISINKGLLCLGNVISALTDESRKDKHIPYRDSKLTRILQDSLGGNSRTTMIACVSPAESNYEESLNSIKYASRARNIKNKAVVNRDPNSLLIDSLRGQINVLKGEISEYQKLLQDNNVAIPINFQEAVQKRMDDSRKSTVRSPTDSPDFSQSLIGSGSTNVQEIREAKIKLSKKEGELKQAKEDLNNLLEKMSHKDTEMFNLQAERDSLRLKNEKMKELLQTNNIQFDLDELSSQSLIDEYKLKLENIQKELNKKSQEILEKTKRIGELASKKQIDDQLLNKYVEEIKKQKVQIKKYESGEMRIINNSPMSQSKLQQPSNFRINMQAVKNETSSNGGRMSDIQNFVMDAEGISGKFIDNLSHQLDSIFQIADDEGEQLQLQKSPRRSRTPIADEGSGQHQSSDDEGANTHIQETEDPNMINEKLEEKLEEKEKILSITKGTIQDIQSKLVEMLSHKYEQQVAQLELDMKNIDNEKQATLKRTTDSNQAQQVELNYKQKMDDMAKQVQILKEKAKEQEAMKRQVTLKESKISKLEDDINRMKKNKETLEKQMKTESDKFSKYKQSVSKELLSARKAMTDKEREVSKLKHDLKKTDQQMQTKVHELRGMQKRVLEDRLRKEMERKEELDNKGIDIDRIKVWIGMHTDKLLRNRELVEGMQKHSVEKERIEDEMFSEGDKLNISMLEKERKEIEYQQLQMIAETQEEPDEGPIIEIEEEIYKLATEIQNSNNTLESLEETLEFHTQKLNQLKEQVIALDAENIEPLKFSGLHSIDAAKVTLQTLLSILLDVNIYNRDLEIKCIESDESILDLNRQISAFQSQVEELTTKLLNQGSGIVPHHDVSSAAAPGASKIPSISKEKAIKNIVNQALEGIVEYENVKHLGLTPNEQNSLTKLSLSKIVANIKQELNDEKKRNHNLVLKLEQALQDKDSYRLKYDNLRKKMKDEAISKDPLSLQQQNTTSQPSQPVETAKPFSSLAAARASRRQQQSVKTTTAQNDSEKLQQTPIASNKYRQRLTLQQQKAVSDEQQAETRAAKFAAGGQTHSGRMNAKKASFIVPNSARKSDSHSRGEEGSSSTDVAKPIPKQPNYMNRIKSNPGPTALQVAQVNKKLHNNIPQLKLKQQEEVQILNQQDTSIVDQSQGRVIVPNLKDRRNQRKMHQEDASHQNEADKMAEEIDKIKETASQITSNQAHYDRKQSRARAYTSKIQNERAFSNGRSTLVELRGGNIDVTNLKDLEEDENEDSPRMMIRHDPMLVDQQSYDAEEEGAIQEPNEMESMPMTQMKQIVGQWSHEELAQIENYGQILIGSECLNGKILLFFDNFMVRQIDLTTFEESINPFNILHLNSLPPTSEVAVDFAIDKELGAIAIASSCSIYIFDFNFALQNKISCDGIDTIERVVFCFYNIVALVNAQDSIFVICYQTDDGSEIGMFELKTEGHKTLMQTDNTAVYLASGIKLAKVTIPDMCAVYIIETEHQAPIIDFTLTPSTIVTTSQDRSVKVQVIESGEQCMNSVDDLECDLLESCEDFVITRIMDGAQYLIWRYYQGDEDLEFLDEINLEELRSAMGEVIDFKMKGKILTKFSNASNAPHYDVVLLVTVIQDAILVNALKHKPLSEM